MGERRTAGPAVYHDYDQAELDRQYSPSSRAPRAAETLAAYTRRSDAVRAQGFAQSCLRYGPGPEERVELFLAADPDGPAHIFVHGGYWQELGVADSAFAAADLVPAGVSFGALGYGLAPRHSLDEIVRMVRAGLWAALTRFRGPAGAPPRTHLSGSSAGAHLVAMALAEGWTPTGEHPADLFASATLLSGVYDLEPIRRSYVNNALGLDQAAALRNSPLRALPSRLPPLIVARGEHETEEFARQHAEFVAAARTRGGPVADLVVAGRDHFDLPFDLGARGTALGDAVLAAMGR